MSTTVRISHEMRKRVEIYRELVRRETGEKPYVKDVVEQMLDNELPTNYDTDYVSDI